MNRSLLSIAASLCIVAAQPAHATLSFADWTSIETTTDIARGNVDSVGVTLSGTAINGGIVNGSSSFFSNPTLFTPAIPLGDVVELASLPGTSNFTITFAQAVVNPVIHLADYSSIMVFAGLSPIKMSGNEFLSVSGSTVSAPPTGGAQTGLGTIKFEGVFTDIAFSATSAGEGFYLQVGFDPLLAVPEPTTIALMFAGLACLSWRIRSKT